MQCVESNLQVVLLVFRKRSNKTAVKPGRKKSKKNQPTDQGTPRTRAAVAREAAARAAMEAEVAAAKAAVAAEQAAAAEKYVLQVPPLETQYQTPPRTPTRLFYCQAIGVSNLIHVLTPLFAHRNSCLDLQVVNHMEEGVAAVAEPGAKKFTPRKKKLATKVRKTPTRKKTPATKKGKK